MLASSTAQVAAVFVECIFYGMYLVTFFASIHTVIQTTRPRPLFRRLYYHGATILAVYLMFTVSTLNLVLGFVRIIQGYEYDERSGGGAVEQLGVTWVNIVKPLCVNIQTMVADMVVIYRCWVLYAKSYRVIVFPVFLFFGAFACTIASMHTQWTMNSGSRVTGGALYPILIGFWSATITLNIYTTTMIVTRIWRVVRQTSVTKQTFPLYPTKTQSRLQITMRIIIESALIYTVISIIVFITQVSSSNAIFIASAAEIQVIGIAFNLILIRAKKTTETAKIRPSDIVQTSTTPSIQIVHSSVNSGSSGEQPNSTGQSLSSRVECIGTCHTV